MIHILDQNIINKIAAGEVVERPASVVKELIENSLDAGATQIEIKIEKGGIIRIQVNDNGIGMNASDLELALKPHATSKIQTFEDLSMLASHGFRGEALASISSVCDFTITSKTKNDPQGHKIHTSATTPPTLEPVAAETGTSITCKNLFYNVPARQKFLKNPSTEFSHILAVFMESALINSQVGYTLLHNNRTIYHLNAEETFVTRIKKLFGNTTFETLMRIEFSVKEYAVKGFISAPQHAREKALHTYTFINRRPVKDYLIVKATKQGYGSVIMDREQPNLFLDVLIDPTYADVNVHPRKLEVRHQNPGEVFSFIKAAVERALKDVSFTPVGKASLVRAPQTAYKPSRSIFSSGKSSTSLSPSPQARQTIFEPESRPEQPKTWRLLGQLHKSYIAIENKDGLLLIDQHAAQERINYEKLAQEDTSVAKQSLAIPTTLELTSQEKGLIETYTENLKNLGFDIEQMSGSTVSITSIPAALPIQDPGALLKDILEDIIDESKQKTALDTIRKKVIDIVACRSAIKFGDPLTPEEQIALIETLEKTPNNHSCTHGRPTTYTLSLGELDKLFKRR